MPVVCSALEQGIALVTIVNPRRRNALGVQEFQELAACWDALEADPGLRCVVVTGDGPDAFCSGAQLDIDFTQVGDVDAMVDSALMKTRVFPRPLVAAVNGHCVAGGFELMLACDLRVASRAAKFGLPEVHWGIVPSGGGAMKLVEQIGQARAMQLLLTGELVSAEQAMSYGLLNGVVEPGDVLGLALALAQKIRGNSPMAVQHAKRLALSSRLSGWKEREPAERVAARQARQSGDQEIGRNAFLSKSDPVYLDHDTG